MVADFEKYFHYSFCRLSADLNLLKGLESQETFNTYVELKTIRSFVAKLEQKNGTLEISTHTKVIHFLNVPSQSENGKRF